MNFFVIPDHAGLGDVAGFCCIEAAQMADAFAVFRVLSVGDVNAVFVKHRRRIDFARALRRKDICSADHLLSFVFRRIAIGPPDFFQIIGVAFFHRLRIEGVTKSVAAAKKYELFSIHFSGGWGTAIRNCERKRRGT